MHIAIIPDGNRRYAKRLLYKPWEGHNLGTKKVEELINWIVELNIYELTFYTFSTENFNRNKEEIDKLFEIFRKNFKELKEDKKIDDNSIKIKFIGRLNIFPDDIQDMIRELMDKTKDNSKHIINLALGYGSKAEIVDAVKAIIKDEIDYDRVDEETIENYLYLKSQPDILIRTGGDRRISNFLLWQSAYTEFFFLDKLWPEFTKDDLVNCIEEFNSRERRFGR